MKAIVVYESVWGNTERIARAVAEGLGPDTTLLSTAEANPAALAGADLLVAGSPVFGFSVPSDQAIDGIRANPGNGPAPDVSQPSMRSWLTTVPQGKGRAAAFETRIWWSPGGATSGILRALEKAGYEPVAKGQRFIVKGKHGPLRDGEVDRARRWGEELAAKAS
jgi:hypothetical protein